MSSIEIEVEFCRDQGGYVERFFYGVGLHAHQERQGLRRHVVGTLRRTARIQPQIRIMLTLQKRLRISSVGLLHAHHVTALGVALAAGIECNRRAFDFNLAETKQLEHLSRRAWIRLCARNYERVWR